jgi:adenylyltransferase/sulfurtransferase
MKRYERQIALPEIGISGQEKLSKATVLVIGAGGLGCPVLQNLAGAGVGCIGIVDGDVVEESNLHRQFLYTLSDIGKNKAMTAAAVVSKQNPAIKVVLYATYFTKENAFELLADYQIIVDCTDILATRYLINDVALVKSIPMVYASIHKMEGQLSVFNYQAGPTYRCLFPEKTNTKETVNCNDSGVLGVLPNTLGALQATEVLKIILEIGTVLSGKLFLYDGLEAKTQTLTFDKNPIEVQNGLLNGLSILKNAPKIVKSITSESFIEEVADENNLIIDLRETYEEPKLDFPTIKTIPIDELENYLSATPKNQKIILLCSFGNKSLLAAEYLLKNGFTNLFHLQKGINALKEPLSHLS